MLRLISFLYSSRNIFLFLFLEGIALFLIIRYNTPQRHALGDSLLNVSLRLGEQRSHISSYFQLQTINRQLFMENENLLEENLRLKQKLEKLFVSPLADSAGGATAIPVLDSSYQLIGGRIIQNSTDRSYNYFTLNVGENDGVEPNMGVISRAGVAGRIIRTTDDYSMAVSLINQSLKLSIKSKNKDNIGVFQWPGISPRKGFAKIIPSDQLIEINDTLVTSGYSHVFPADYLVGYVDSVGTQTAEGFYEVWMNLATDFYRLNQAFVVKNLNKPLLDSLERQVRLENE